MYQFEADVAVHRGLLEPPAGDGGTPAEVLCDGCGQPWPCTTAARADQRELAADFARGYSGL